jgi:hypothetical protein
MSDQQFKLYETTFGPEEKQKVANILAKNEEHVKNNGVLIKKVSLADMDDKFADEKEEDKETVAEANVETSDKTTNNDHK